MCEMLSLARYCISKGIQWGQISCYKSLSLPSSSWKLIMNAGEMFFQHFHDCPLLLWWVIKRCIKKPNLSQKPQIAWDSPLLLACRIRKCAHEVSRKKTKSCLTFTSTWQQSLTRLSLSSSVPVCCIKKKCFVNLSELCVTWNIPASIINLDICWTIKEFVYVFFLNLFETAAAALPQMTKEHAIRVQLAEVSKLYYNS